MVTELTLQQPILLVVEDDPTQQKVIRILAETFGYGAVIVSTGKEALDALKVSDSCFDAILMDFKMPRMDGIETTRRIRESEAKTGRRTPIIAVTAYSSEFDQRACLEAGMDDYLSKPFEPESLRKVLLRWTYNSGKPNLRLLPRSGPHMDAAP